MNEPAPIVPPEKTPQPQITRVKLVKRNAAGEVVDTIVQNFEDTPNGHD